MVSVSNTVMVNDFDIAKTVMTMDDWHARAPPEKFILERSFNKNLGIINYGCIGKSSIFCVLVTYRASCFTFHTSTF
jgi:hypothetical protein